MKVVQLKSALIVMALLTIAGYSAKSQVMLERAVIAESGGTVTNGTTVMDYTVAQPVTGTATNGSTSGTFGFWSDIAAVSGITDLNGAGTISSLNVVPNPATVATRLELELAAPGTVQVSIIDSRGAQVARINAGPRQAGRVEIPLDLNGLASGSYHAVVTVPGAMLQKAFVITR